MVLPGPETLPAARAAERPPTATSEGRMTTHTVKSWPEYFEAIADGTMTFNLRKDDRGYEVGDLIEFEEYRPSVGEYTGETVTCRIGYILKDFDGLMPGYVILGLTN
jgi:hypothetical protein